MSHLLEQRILVVDDSANNLVLIKAYLKSEGYRMDTAAHGGEAVLKVQSARYDAVLMDVQMPVKDGYTATREIRAWERTTGRSPVPIVALTANAMKGEDLRSREAGCSGYLSKPVSRVTLLEELQRHLQRTRSSHEEQPTALAPEIEARIPQYLAGRQREIPVIKALLQDGLWDEIRRIAHNLKGSGAGYGFPEITTIGADLIVAAKSQHSGGILEQLALLESVVNRTASGMATPA